MAQVIELTFVDEKGNITIIHPMTDMDCVPGLRDALDTLKNDSLLRTGGTMLGEIDMDGNAIRNLPEPVEDDDLVTMGYLKNYVDNTFLGGAW